MQTQEKPHSQVKTLFVLLALFIGSVLVTALFAYVWLEHMTCRGSSNFEGGCGYGAVMAAAGLSLILCPVLFAGSALLYFKRRKGSGALANASQREVAVPASGLVTQWRVVFALTLAVNVLPLLLIFSDMYWSARWLTALSWLGVLMLLVNGFMAYKVAARMGQQPIIMAVASVVVGWMGAAGVFIYLHTLIGRAQPKASRSTDG